MAIRDMIVDGELGPGERIIENDLCKTLGVSRTPVREAMKSLAIEGLVELRPNKSPRVTEMSISEVRYLFEVLSALETLAAFNAAARISDSELAEVVDCHHSMVAAYKRKDIKKYFDLNQDIHRRIILAARNPVLLQIWDSLALRVRRAKFLSNLLPERWEVAVGDHERMLDALSARDGARLASLMEPHLMKGIDAVKLYLETRARPDKDRASGEQAAT